MKNLRHYARQSPLIIFGVSLFMAGIALGAAATAWASLGTTAQLRAGLVEAAGREQALTDLLRAALNNQTEDNLIAKVSGFASASDQPLQAPAAASSPGAEASQPAPTSPAVAPATQVQAPRPVAASMQKATAVLPATPSHQKAQLHAVASPAPSQQPAAAPADPPTTQIAVMASPAQSTPTTTLAAIPPTNGRLEAVTAAKAQVDALDKAWVRMTSGQTIRVNEKFPSGETLISVDPAKSQIVTDRRVLLIL